ncbi:MAG: HIT domain-containing protein [Phycisphaeraceae bacterium]
MSEPRPLWAPWRIDYLRSSLPELEQSECFLCLAGEPSADQATLDARLVLAQTESVSVLLNRYPYTNGHLLVAPNRHVAELSDLDYAELTALMHAIAWAEKLVRAAVCAQGVNIGMNLGRCAGAAVPGHLHAHVVPRWNGDVNFMETIGNARIMPQALEQALDDLRVAIKKAEPLSSAS